MAVREFDGVDDHIILGGDGAAIANWGFMILLRPLTLSGDRCFISATNGTTTTHGSIYTNSSTVQRWGSGTGDSQFAMTLNTTQWWLIGATKASGTTAPRGHARNWTTMAAASHMNGASSLADTAGNWTQTRIGVFHDSTGDANMRVASAAIFENVYSDADFESVATGTANFQSLGAVRIWDFNQASTATDVNNLLTGTDDQSAITGTTVVADGVDDPPGWTFGLTTAFVGGGGDPPRPGRHRGRLPARQQKWF
jgi:hypothetical protein